VPMLQQNWTPSALLIKAQGWPQRCDRPLRLDHTL
jgi:hypothetical protein